jgi:3-oxoacyl-[acyl-carrier protein] reductase
MGRLDGRIAIVTGGARGLGAAAAVRLAAEGAQTGILDLREAAATRDQIRAAGGVCESWLCDTTDEDPIAAAFPAIQDRFGGVDVLVNNAGILQPRSVSLEMSKAEVERFVEVYYVG